MKKSNIIGMIMIILLAMAAFIPIVIDAYQKRSLHILFITIAVVAAVTVYLLIAIKLLGKE